jgi:hypothetical protein
MELPMYGSFDYDSAMRCLMIKDLHRPLLSLIVKGWHAISVWTAGGCCACRTCACQPRLCRRVLPKLLCLLARCNCHTYSSVAISNYAYFWPDHVCLNWAFVEALARCSNIVSMRISG